MATIKQWKRGYLFNNVTVRNDVTSETFLISSVTNHINKIQAKIKVLCTFKQAQDTSHKTLDHIIKPQSTLSALLLLLGQLWRSMISTVVYLSLDMPLFVPVQVTFKNNSCFFEAATQAHHTEKFRTSQLIDIIKLH